MAHRDAYFIQVNEHKRADPASRQRLHRPRTNPTEADHHDTSTLQPGGRLRAIEATYAVKAESVCSMEGNDRDRVKELSMSNARDWRRTVVGVIRDGRGSRFAATTRLHAAFKHGRRKPGAEQSLR